MLPVTTAKTLDQQGVSVGIVAAINLVSRVSTLTSVYIARVTGAHQPWFGWAPPIRARVKGPSSRWARSGGDQPNILPLDLNFTFNLILSNLFVSSHIGT